MVNEEEAEAIVTINVQTIERSRNNLSSICLMFLFF
jgi:hypothetical protein